MLPEIREADAPPEIAAIYADIKAAAALPQVNLIFRYLATRPGVLESLWPVLRPLYRSEQLFDAGCAIFLGLAPPPPSPLAGILPADETAICRMVIASYNEANPQNLIALTALAQALATDTGPAAPAQPLTPRTSTATPDKDFPALPRRDTLPPDLRTRVDTLAARHEGTGGAIPSMYLHLALWPAALTAADDHLAPIVAAPDWRTQVDTVIAHARESAALFTGHLQAAAANPDPAVKSEVATNITTFINAVIPEMIVVGRYLALEEA